MDRGSEEGSGSELIAKGYGFIRKAFRKCFGSVSKDLGKPFGSVLKPFRNHYLTLSEAFGKAFESSLYLYLFLVAKLRSFAYVREVCVCACARRGE